MCLLGFELMTFGRAVGALYLLIHLSSPPNLLFYPSEKIKMDHGRLGVGSRR